MQAQGLQVDLLSAFPGQITGSWSERVIVSFMPDFLPLIALDLTGLWRDDSDSTAANGQYLWRNNTCSAIAGHKAIFEMLVNNFPLAKHVRFTGHKAAPVDGTSMLSYRMYHNACEVCDGFSSNILLGLSPPPYTHSNTRMWFKRRSHPQPHRMPGEHQVKLL